MLPSVYVVAERNDSSFECNGPLLLECFEVEKTY